jgi:hypothetical protein
MRRTCVCVALAIAVAASLYSAWQAAPSKAEQADKSAKVQPDQPPETKLPITHVYLFSSGVGYFQREGNIDGDRRVDLTFPVTDINDLLKSLVLEDMGGGKITTIGYDSHDPIEKTLKSFALDLTYNPSFGQLLNQARGEKVEVVIKESNAGQPATMQGTIMGMESQQQPHGKDALVDVDILNLLCQEGVRSVNLKDVQRLRFLNAALDKELRGALEVLASSHDALKKVVTLSFKGDGKRGVKVGYVVESPIWKSSYRLVLDKGGKLRLQGWASIENTSDEDWSNVRMALIAGRPISFQMNIYQPLYIPRPVVEPEKFASLRPPMYGGSIANADQIAQGQQSPGQAGQGGLGQFGQIGGGGIGGMQGGIGGQIGGGGNLGWNRYQNFGNFGNLGGQLGLQGGNLDNNGRLSYEQLQQRRAQQQAAKGEAKKVGKSLAALDPTQGIGDLPDAEEIGDYFRYVIDDKVTLPRQKSAMLAVVNQPVEGTRVSIYNEFVQAKHPLLGLKFKNTTDQPLMQGPITVYEEGSYAGDARLPDLQPKEERLISYAIDQGTEVKPEQKSEPRQLMAVKVVKGLIHATHKLRETKVYTIKNRSQQERTLIISHPYRPDWKVVGDFKPLERSRDLYRFECKVPAGKTVIKEVVEEQSRLDHIALNNTDDKTIRLFISSNVSSKAAKEGLKKVIDLRTNLAGIRTELEAAEKQLKTITDDQSRLRANLEKVPKESNAFKRYVKKFDTQETQIEKLQDDINKMQEVLKKHEKEFADYILGADW